MINIVFCPDFVADGEVTIDDLLSHIDKIIELGGEKHIGLGSDFDGIVDFVKDLEHSGDYQNLLTAIENKYGEGFTRGIASENFIRVFC